MMQKKPNSRERVRRATSAHGVLGVAIAAGLFLVCLSGTVSVFKDQLEMFEQRKDIPHVTALGGDELLRAARAGMEAEPDSKHLLVYPPTAETEAAIIATDNRAQYVD